MSGRIRAAASFATSGILAVLFVYPFYVLVTAAIKTPQEIERTPPTYIPQSLTLQNFARLAELGDGIWVHLGNSAILGVITVIGTIAVSLLGGWGFARYRFPGQRVVFILMLSALMVPYQPLLTPLFLVLKWLHLQNSLLGLSLVYITFQLPFALFVMRNAFLDIPRELEDAARVDGASGTILLRNVFIPLLRPAIVTVGLFAFFSAWNEFLSPLVLLSDQSQFPLPVALRSAIVSGLTGVNWPLLQSGVLVTMLPCLILFFIFQRYYASGLIAGAVKG
jgi:multiple sugar transport system permease protein